MNELKTIEFNNQTLLTIQKDGIYYVAMKPICDNLGLSWSTQRVKIMDNIVLSSSVSIIDMVAEDGKTRPMTCLPIDMINGWLFTININKVSEEIRPIITKYQKECYRVLYEYWHKREVSIAPKQQCFLDIIDAKDELSTTLAIKRLDETIIRPLEHKVEEQSKELSVARPKAEFYDSVTQSDTTLDIGAVSKILNYKGLGRNKLFRYLRDNKIINHKNIPYQQFITSGYFKLNTQDLEVSIKAVMFQKGIDWL